MIERDAEARAPSSMSIPRPARRSRRKVTGGAVKCQWKADWAMRWTALGVDYEMAGKDLIDCVTLSSKICKALGGTPPEGFNYELFLDEKGQKISKSKGNGLTIEEWLTYAQPESLSLFMYQKPKAAKKLYFDVIPRAVDEYLQFIAAYPAQDGKAEARQSGLAHPLRARRRRPSCRSRSGCCSISWRRRTRTTRRVLWGFIRRHRAGRDAGEISDARPARRLCGPLLRRLREADEGVPRADGRRERTALMALDAALADVTAGATAEELQTLVYEAGKANGFAKTRCATGSRRSTRCCSARPRARASASFIELYGVAETRALIAKALAGELLKV